MSTAKKLDTKDLECDYEEIEAMCELHEENADDNLMLDK
jgi:hypothetical protein